MPESRSRKKPAYKPIADIKREVSREPVRLESPRWLAPTMVTLMIVGLLYVVVFYIAGNSIPVMKDLTNLENVGIGFGLMSIGFYLATRWK